MTRTNVQSSNAIFMVRPASFGYNEQTAESNYFQNKNAALESVADRAVEEFDNAVRILTQEGISVLVVQDTISPTKPDAVFPNNWLSTHHNGCIVLYPMCTPNRRLERHNDLLTLLQEHFQCGEVLDLSIYEGQDVYLEGTGSIVFDHEAKVAYACVSPRTDASLLKALCKKMQYKPCIFHAYDTNDQLVYHTNVIMAIGSAYAIVCLDSIKDEQERHEVITLLREAHKEVINISLAQVYDFAGNAIEVIDNNGNCKLILSLRAYHALSESQKDSITAHATMVPIPIPTIEEVGGGSIRCMIGQIFLSKS